MDYDIRKLTDYLWELPKTGGMRVPARIYATEEMIAQIVSDKAPQQAANVAHLPGIVTASLAMPDIHWGYGFPIGGVAATDPEEGVISPGGVGYDINCGVRLLASRLTREQVEPRLRELVNQLFRDVPTGVGAAGALTVSVDELRCVVERGARWAVEQGYGSETDLEHTEERGCIDGADPAESRTARGSAARPVRHARLGQPLPRSRLVAEIYDEEAARVMGLPRTDHRHDPLRLARPGLPGLRRLPRRDGQRGEEVRHRAARPAARLRAGRSARRAALPRRDAGAANYACATASSSPTTRARSSKRRSA